MFMTVQSLNYYFLLIEQIHYFDNNYIIWSVDINGLSVSELRYSISVITVSILIFMAIYIASHASSEVQSGLNESVLYSDKHKLSFPISHQLVGPNALESDHNNTILKSDNHQNESLMLNNQSELQNFSFTRWYDPLGFCNAGLECAVNRSTGWKDRTSIQLSTSNTDNKKLKIVGQEVDVKPKERYEFVIHIKQNKWATQSHADMEGFNETSKQWNSTEQCPSVSIIGAVDWQEFRCSITIIGDVYKIRPVLSPGWSSERNKRAETLFDSINLAKFRPFLSDANLKTEVVSQGLKYPVSMAFLGPNDFLVTENNGTVQRIINGVALDKPLLSLDVTADGLLGIAIDKNVKLSSNASKKPTYVFLRFVTTKNQDSSDSPAERQLANRLYRYEFVNNSLLNPKLILDLPGGFYHNGGVILIAPDRRSLYLPLGDIENENYQVVANKAINNKTGKEPDGTGGILRVTLDGKPVRKTALGNSFPTNLYFSYGTRQSFGIDFDPVTGKLWDTENGANWGDEINLVEQGFNGGWNKVQGIWKDHVRDLRLNDSNITYNPSGLVNFDGKGKYRTPEFTWKYTVGPTALKFLTSDKLGIKYQNDMFVADVNNGRIYNFNLSHNRTELSLIGPLADKVADTDSELDDIIFAGGFGIITDLKIGPDGYLYFVAHSEGKIYKIVPRF
jgi:glucose/arabinose dehydrogenase